VGSEPKLDQNKHEQPVSFMSKVLTIGFFGGLFWSHIGYLAYILNLTDIGPGVFLSPWALGEWKNGTTGHFVSIGLISLLSMLVATGYKIAFVKMKGILPSLLFGAVLWGLVFYVLNPIFIDLPSIRELNKDTIVTSSCLFILYGIFIGFSVSFEYEEMKQAKARGQEDTVSN
jgi:hypothetical protein